MLLAKMIPSAHRLSKVAKISVETTLHVGLSVLEARDQMHRYLFFCVLKIIAA
jgi:hypothetical protein